MKKILVGVITIAVALSVVSMANAEEQGSVKIKGKAENSESTTKITGEEKGGEIRKATVTKTAKETQRVLERKVKFHSYDQDTDTISVIQEKKLVRYQTNNLDSKRPYVLKWEKEKPIVITSTYDPKLGKDVVISATAAPLQPKK